MKINKNLHNYKIELRSYRLIATRKWRPKVILIRDKKYQVIEAPLLWDREFPTKKEADHFALAQARMFLQRGNFL